MKKEFLTCAMASLLFGVTACCTASADQNKDQIYIGSCMYDLDNSYLVDMRQGQLDFAKEVGARIEIVNAFKYQPRQNEQADVLIRKGIDAMVMNTVDHVAGFTLVDKTREAGIPIVFLNRLPHKRPLKGWEHVYYINTNQYESGIIDGELIAEYFLEHPEADKNGDGVIQYVVMYLNPIKGRDVFIENVNTSFAKLGVKGERIAFDSGNWNREQGYLKMAGMLKEKGIDNIEAIFSLNDDMAVGIISALQEYGYNKDHSYGTKMFVPLVGVDALPEGVQAVGAGRMIGTAQRDPIAQGRLAAAMCYYLAKGEKLSKENIGYDLTDDHYVWMHFNRVDQTNYMNFNSVTRTK